MFEWVITNKAWLFDGVAVVVPLTIIGWIIQKASRKTVQLQRGGDGSTNIQTGDFSNVSISSLPQAKQDVKTIKIDRGCAVKFKTEIAIGDFQEVIWGENRIRITVYDVVKEDSPGCKSETKAAEIAVSTGGGLIFGGEECKKVDVNKYRVPLKESSDEEKFSIYWYHVSNKYFSFVRIFVDHLNYHENRVTLDLCFVDTKMMELV